MMKLHQQTTRLCSYLNFCTLIAALSRPSTRAFTPQGSTTKMLIVDTDAGFDDFIAMKGLVKRNNTNDAPRGSMSSSISSSINPGIHIISTVAGMQEHPSVAKEFLESNFPESVISVGRDIISHCDDDGDIGVIITEEKPLPPPWLIQYRSLMDTFLDNNKRDHDSQKKQHHHHQHHHQQQQRPLQPNNLKIESFLKSQPNNSVDLICIGPLTNIADWITTETTSSLIQSKIHCVWIMGGNIPAHRRSTNANNNNNTSRPEFNFNQDPKAAHIVLSSSILANKIYILPEETCIDIPSNDKTVIEIRKVAMEKNHGMISKILQMNGDANHTATGQFRYDPLCAFAYIHPDKIDIEIMEVSVDSRTGLIFLFDDEEPLSSSSGQSIKFVTNVERNGEDGYLKWILDLVNDE